jgi:L-ribulokinase
VQIYADVLGESISVHPCQYGPALGAAILGTLAAGREISGFDTSAAAIEAMAGPRPGNPQRQLRTFQPNQQHRQAYEAAYNEYCQLADVFAKRG